MKKGEYKQGDYVVHKKYGLCRVSKVYWGAGVIMVESLERLNGFNRPITQYLLIATVVPAKAARILEAKLKGLI